MALKTAWKLKSHKKINSLIGNRDTTDRDIHHIPTRVNSAPVFLYSSLSSTSMVTGGHTWGVEIYSTRVKARAKRSRILQNTENNHSQS